MPKGIDDALAAHSHITVLSGNDVVLAEIKRILKAAQAWYFQELAKPLLNDPAILHRAVHAVEDLGVVGERKSIGLLHLQFRSRVLKRPINTEINSPSSTGKTFLVTTVATLENSDACYELTASSEKALIYIDESLEHRILYIQEPEGLAQGAGYAAIKSLVWEGRLKYDTVVKEGGDIVGKHIEKDGPTGLIVTSTRPLDDQTSNRLLRIELDASKEQTRRILEEIAKRESGDGMPVVDLRAWHALAHILGEPSEVDIPFAKFLALHISTSALRMRRDFTHQLTLIKASAVEYQYQRARSSNNHILATVADYAHVHSLVDEVFQAAQEEGITKPDRDMVASVEYLTSSKDGQPVSQAEIAAYLELSKSQVSYRVNRLLKIGYLTNSEKRKGYTHQLLPGAPLPEKVPALPSPCEVAEYLVQNGRTDLIVPWVDPVTGIPHSCYDHLQILSSNQTPEQCPRCLQNEAEFNSGSNSSGTNRTPEHEYIGSSGVRIEAKPHPATPDFEAEQPESSGVRSEEAPAVIKPDKIMERF
ncbi:hypothetical protein ACFLVW_02585 [Chloroflexota bacterium]